MDPDLGRRAAEAVLRELEAGLSRFVLSVALSRPAPDPVDLHRAGAEALLAANVAVAQDDQVLAFEETGAYRLLLPAMSEDPGELQRFHDETVAPLVAYDDQYETELVKTLESFLEADGNVAKTASKLFTHRHTVRYRLERVRELTGLDVGSTDGRERLGLGLKAMRVLGIALPQGPASERGRRGRPRDPRGQGSLTGPRRGCGVAAPARGRRGGGAARRLPRLVGLRRAGRRRAARVRRAADRLPRHRLPARRPGRRRPGRGRLPAPLPPRASGPAATTPGSRTSTCATRRAEPASGARSPSTRSPAPASAAACASSST